jgi:hypothetical protein
LTLVSPVTAVVPVVVSLDYIGSASQSVRNLHDIAWREQIALVPFMLLGILGGLYLPSFSDTEARLSNAVECPSRRPIGGASRRTSWGWAPPSEASNPGSRRRYDGRL